MGNCFATNSTTNSSTDSDSTNHDPQSSQSGNIVTSSSKTTPLQIKPIIIHDDNNESNQNNFVSINRNKDTTKNNNNTKRSSTPNAKQKSHVSIERRHRSQKNNNERKYRSNPQTPKSKSRKSHHSNNNNNNHSSKTSKLNWNPNEYDGIIPKENQNIGDINRILHTYKVIGKGGSCDVVLCRQIDQLPHTSTTPTTVSNDINLININQNTMASQTQNPLLAVKRLNRKHKRASQSIKKEISILQRLSHPNIIKLV